MSESWRGPLETLSHEIEKQAGAQVRDQVMAGSDALTGKSTKADVTKWMKGALIRLDELAPGEQATQIMEHCGEYCARMNNGVIKRAVASRRKFASNDAYINAEITHPSRGTRLERAGDALMQYYVPGAYRPGLRCYCSLVNGLPHGETASLTYCHCSKAFVRTLWQAVLGQPVTVELLHSAISGASDCAFRITLVP